MIFRTPSYYSKFRCTAEKCTDNCCIGWEIDIDSHTAQYYSSLGGEFGQRLKENISADNSFILKDERCPFLNKNNLCDIIINCGENHLCQICRDHPRFFEWYGELKEGGIGLSCEEGARLILTNTDRSFDEIETDEEVDEIDEELFSFLYDARKAIFTILRKEDMPLKERLTQVLDYAEKVQFRIDNYGLDAEAFNGDDAEIKQGSIEDIIALFSDFEPIDKSWTEELNALADYAETGHNRVLHIENSEAEKYMLNIFEYFIWRYFLKGVFDEEILSKVKLAVVSSLVIKAMTKGKTELSAWVQKSKLYSKQMEYSDENKELFFDYTYEKQCLSVCEIKGLLREL